VFRLSSAVKMMLNNRKLNDFNGLKKQRPLVLIIRLGSISGKLSGGEYAYKLIKEALEREFIVQDLAMHKFFSHVKPPILRFILRRILIVPFLILYSRLAFTSYKLVFINWVPRIPLKGHLAYIQPFAGASEQNDGIIYEPHQDRLDFFSLWKRRVENIFPSRFSKRIYLDPHRSKFLIANSYYTRRLIRMQLRRDAFVVYPPVPVDQYQCPRSRREQIVSIGRVSPEKNFNLIGQIGPQIPAKFILIGKCDPSGSQIVAEIKKSFQNQGLSDNFSYFGWVSNATKKSLLEQSKVIFHPAEYEPFGIAVVEGMAAGCIPVAHRSGGIPEFVPDEFLFNTADEALEKLRMALQMWSPELAVQMHKSVIHFNKQRFMDEIMRIVNQVIKK
jgi:glycosyltransferase involved in cell wall biosynthesis